MEGSLLKEKHIHINGIGGKGMAPLAALVHETKRIVSGDDLRQNHRTDRLAKLGINIRIGANTTGPPSTEVVVGGAFCPESNGPTVHSRLGFLNAILESERKTQICVCGSYGKSSAAAILWSALSSSHPSAYIGADVPDTVCGGKFDTGPLAVVEACEYHDSFLALRPMIIFILNIFENHQDWFGEGTAGFAGSLGVFVERNSNNLEAVIVSEQAYSRLDPTLRSNPKVQTFGIGENCNWVVEILECSTNGARFSLFNTVINAPVGRFVVPIVGRHAVTASVGAVVTSLTCGMSIADASKGLERAQLPEGRCMVRYETELCVGVEDNARQPEQVDALISALRQRWPSRLVCLIVNPWGRKNARNLPAWAAALKNADSVVIMPLGDSAVSSGGAEPDNSCETLFAAINNKTEQWIAGSTEEAFEIIKIILNRGLPYVLSTIGYESAQSSFVSIHDQTFEFAARSGSSD